MTFKTVQTFLTDTDLLPGLLGQAEAIAGAYDAHLEAICLGVDRSQMSYYYAGGNALILQEALTRAGEEALEIEGLARKTLARSDIRWATDTEVAQMTDISRRVAGHASFADLVVLPRPYGDGCGIELEPVIEAAMFDGGAPILVAPSTGELTPKPETVLLAWNESPQALRAARAALPFLQAAKSVHVLIIDPPSHGPNRSDPGGMLAAWLTRHGVSLEIDVVARTLPRVSDVIVRHARDCGAGLVVMGAYGHSRFREAILGGATRDMLEHADMPLFMAH